MAEVVAEGYVPVWRTLYPDIMPTCGRLPVDQRFMGVGAQRVEGGREYENFVDSPF